MLQTLPREFDGRKTYEILMGKPQSKNQACLILAQIGR